MAETSSRTARVLALLVAVVGATDAVRGDHWDQVAMLSVIALLLAADLALQRFRPERIRIRADHLEWLRAEAARTDDTAELVAGRAIASYRTFRPNATGARTEP